MTPTQATIAGWLGVGGILGSALLFTAQTPFPSYWAAIPVLSTALVIVAGATTTTRGPAAVLSLRGMVFVGTISYSLYLVHWPMQVIPQTAIGYDNPLPMWVRLLIALAGVPLAWLMYRYVEDPARTAPILTRAGPRRSLLAAAAASTLLVLIATAVLAYSTARPLSDGRIADDTVVSAPPLATSFVPSNMSPSLDAVSTDQPIIYDQDCHRDFGSVDTSGCLYGSESLPRIALFGESHAAQWFPALYAYAQDHGFAVETFTKSSCPSVDVDVARNGVPYGECMKWRSGVIKRLNEDEPDLVVIANFGNAPHIDDEGDYGRAWEEGLERTLTEIRAPRVVLADTPNMHQTPSICLSAHLSDAMACAEPSADALSGPARSAEARATDAARVKLIDMTPYLCGEVRCPPIIGNTLVYRDAHHMTATFSTLLAERLGSQIGPLL